MGIEIGKQSYVASGVFFGSSQVTLGDHAFISVNCFFDGSGHIKIGDYARIGPHVKILTGTHEYRLSRIRRRIEDGTIAKKVVIEPGCWIGMGVSILPGITIQEGCVVAAGAVITNDIAANGLYAGVPARRLRDLSTEEDL